DHLSKKWDAPIYVFFKPSAMIEYVDRRKAHIFECGAAHCRCKSKYVQRFLYTGDASSTSNMHRHAKICWGDETVTTADSMGSLRLAHFTLSKKKKGSGSITLAFKQVGKGKIMYSQRAHTRLEACAEFVCWVTENKQPFQIVNDRAFHSLMKTGWPESFIPSTESLSRDVKNAFVSAHGHIAKMLQEYDGKLSFATDAWTSPNHKAYVAVTIHLEREGKALLMLLDVVEVPK
ncbi:hypothetical protein EI94DRAFT_1558922, partial [Lactarius quietus]